MLICNWMSTRLVSVSPDDTMAAAARLLEDYRIGHLPVLDGKKLVGIVSDRDIKKASASEANALNKGELAYLLDKIKVKEIMTPDPVSVGIYDTVEEASLIMLEKRISGLPVLDQEGVPLAMITKADILRSLVSLSGVTSGGIQFAIDLPDESGSIKKAADLIRKYGGSLVSIMTSYDRVPKGRRRVYIRMKHIDRSRLVELKDELSQVGVLNYVLDNRSGKKELLAMGGLDLT